VSFWLTPYAPQPAGWASWEVRATPLRTSRLYRNGDSLTVRSPGFIARLDSISARTPLVRSPSRRWLGFLPIEMGEAGDTMDDPPVFLVRKFLIRNTWATSDRLRCATRRERFDSRHFWPCHMPAPASHAEEARP